MGKAMKDKLRDEFGCFAFRDLQDTYWFAELHMGMSDVLTGAVGWVRW